MGAFAIILVSLLGISAGFSKPVTGTPTESFTNTTALVANPSASPLFWIGLLIFGSLNRRIFCETAAVICRTQDTVSCGGESGPDTVGPEFFEEEAGGYHAEEDGEFAECLHCAKIISPDQVLECEICGVQGCSYCIRIMGQVSKKMTCRECFEKKQFFFFFCRMFRAPRSLPGTVSGQPDAESCAGLPEDPESRGSGGGGQGYPGFFWFPEGPVLFAKNYFPVRQNK